MDNKINQLEDFNVNPLFENNITTNNITTNNITTNNNTTNNNTTNNNTKDMSSLGSWYSSCIFFDPVSCFECCCKCCCLICLPSF